jgi:hypothetical protein
MNTNSPDEGLDLLDVADVARITRVGRNKAYEVMHSAGPIQLGRKSLRVRRRDLDRYLESQRQR